MKWCFYMKWKYVKPLKDNYIIEYLEKAYSMKYINF